MPGIADAKCVLIIGATSGIGRALAQAILALPSKPTVIVAGRRKERLVELANKGFKTVQFDVTAGRETSKTFTQDITVAYPDLDTVIFSSGIQMMYDFKNPDSIDLDGIENEFNTNYISIVALIKFFLPHLFKLGEQNRPSFIVPITSSLAIVPGPWVANYCATKAALHSLSLSLDSQLQGTNVHVMEIFPPLVESELHDHQGKTPQLSKIWMPLNEFTEKAMEGLLRGDVAIPVGMAADVWPLFEQGKSERIAQSVKRFT